MSDSQWLPLKWVNPPKHRPVGGNIDWDDVVRKTAFGRKVSKYKNGMTPQQIRAIEMKMSSEDADEEGRQWGLIAEKDVERFYYVVEDETIGASLGEETNIVKVHRGKSGFVHGYPITRGQLQDELRKHNQAELRNFQQRWPE